MTPIVAFAQKTPEAKSSSPISQFELKFDARAIVSLKHTDDRDAAEFIQPGRSLGKIILKYRDGEKDWQPGDTSESSQPGSTTVSQRADGTEYRSTSQIPNDRSADLTVETRMLVQRRAILWTFNIRNRTNKPLEIGDLEVPLPIGRFLGQGRGVILKHSFVSGHGSFMFWTRSDNRGPCLVLTPLEGTNFEYWDAQSDGRRTYTAYIHSLAAVATIAQQGGTWRQPHTSLTLAPQGRPGDAKIYGCKFEWADDYDAVRNILFDERLIDVHVVPGMTVPSDLFAEFALRTKQPIVQIDAEFPGATAIESLGQKGDFHLFKVRFSKLGENRLTVNYGTDRQMFLEFFSTEPLETLIKKRGAFLARCQHRDPSKWYDGLITDWNMETQTLISPDHYDPIPINRVYAVTCDDPGLGKPAYLASKNAEYPVQSEVEALDYYIRHFIWGGLQRTTEETYPFAIYGIPDWKTNRESSDPGRKGRLHLWRIYDYPHVIVLYFAMYRIAKHYPQINTALAAREYLERAYGTAVAMYTIPHEIWSDWSVYGTAFYNELIVPDLVSELNAVGMTTEADRLRGFWERKVKAFASGRQDLFRSEYPFDSTGFESTHALAKYAVQHADRFGAQANLGVSREDANRFLETQMGANIFCRGWLEPAYYYLGSDYRGGGGNAYTLTYMSQMGGWSVLDYALNFARDPSPYLRLGYASYLSAWALMNTGTPQSNYGYWYPGEANDGAAGGGFEPAAYGRTWLGQPHHRGSWYFSSEIDLGYCGALRTAATVLADDPIFGRFCFGGDWRKTAADIEIIPKDGLRRRIHAMLTSGNLHLALDNDRFAAGQSFVLEEDLSRIQFTLESDNPAAHAATLRIRGLKVGDYTMTHGAHQSATIRATSESESVVELPMEPTNRSIPFVIARRK
jgi:hypothetical protein